MGNSTWVCSMRERLQWKRRLCCEEEAAEYQGLGERDLQSSHRDISVVRERTHFT